ncbi:hypothetical protein [Lyngbya aestuarii]|uniref:hypothetical protein n=1 Tax=Lyngbya aestuarii TaxID=118322 RepID=UPI00403DBA87
MTNKWLVVSTTVLLSIPAYSLQIVAQAAEPDHQSKLFQCHQIINIANDAVSDTNKAHGGKQASETELMLIAANYMDHHAHELERVYLTDPVLQGYQSQFVKMYQDTGKAARDFVVAFNRQDRTEAELAIQALQAATSGESQLVEDINNYCQSPLKNQDIQPSA